MTTGPAWYARARCRPGRAGSPGPATFVGTGLGARDSHEQAIVEEWCVPCPVRDACRAHGREHGEYGVWGETELQRRRFSRPPDAVRSPRRPIPIVPAPPPLLPPATARVAPVLDPADVDRAAAAFAQLRAHLAGQPAS